MAGKREQHQKKKREKQRKKRDVARKSRSAKSGRNTRAAEWPLSESWISQNWHEQGAVVHAMLTRTHSSGRMAAAVFEVDLATKGVTSVTVLADAHPAEVQQELAKRSEDIAGMQVTEPELVVKLVREAEIHGEMNNVKQPADIGAGLALFPDVDARDCPHAILTGNPSDAQAGGGAASGGLWASLKSRLGMG